MGGGDGKVDEVEEDPMERLFFKRGEIQHKSGKKKVVSTNMGSGALPGKMLLVRIVENNQIYAYFC